MQSKPMKTSLLILAHVFKAYHGSLLIKKEVSEATDEKKKEVQKDSTGSLPSGADFANHLLL